MIRELNPWISFIIPARATDTNSNTNPEYSEYDEEEPPRSPGNLEKSTPPPLVPYFDQGQVIVYVLPNAKSVKLDCPVKNYDGKWALATPCPPLRIGGVFLMCFARAFSCASCDSLVPQRHAHHQWGAAVQQDLQPGQAVQSDSAGRQCNRLQFLVPHHASRCASQYNGAAGIATQRQRQWRHAPISCICQLDRVHHFRGARSIPSRSSKS